MLYDAVLQDQEPQLLHVQQLVKPNGLFIIGHIAV